MEDFDMAFAFECMPWAQACAGNIEEAKSSMLEAQKFGQAIKDEEDKRIWQAEFSNGDWFGLKTG